MAVRSARVRDGARVALASIRLFNGVTALTAPVAFARRLGGDPSTPGMTYALRLFGVRTVVLGYDLLQPDPDARARAVRIAPLIHAGDATVALLAGACGSVPRRVAGTAAVVSGTNLALSLIAQPPRD